MPVKRTRHCWGLSPWTTRFKPENRHTVMPRAANVVVIGGGFTGLAAAAWLRRLAPQQSVVLLEAAKIGAGASGRTGGMALSESAAGKQQGLRGVLAGLRHALETLEVECDLELRGAWEIAREGQDRSSRLGSLIEWQDGGTLRVVKEVPGGTVDPGKLVSGLARAASRAGAMILEHHRVLGISWGKAPQIEVATGLWQTAKIVADKIIFATNAQSLATAGLKKGMHPRLTLAVLTAPVSESLLHEIGLGCRKPFYTADLPYLWGRVRKDRSLIWGAGLVASPDSNNLEAVNIADSRPAGIFAQLQQRVRHLHPALNKIKFTRQWGGPILFRDSWTPVFDWHPRSHEAGQAIVAGAYAGHGVALSSFLGKWAADILAGRARNLPRWGAIGH